IATQAADFPVIRPFRMYNYLQLPGEDLSSRLYTLGRDNQWEVNDSLTSEYRRLAQHVPQFPSVSQPATVNPQDLWRPRGNGHSQPQVHQEVRMDYTESFPTPPHHQPPSPNIPRQSPRTPVTPTTPPIAGSSIGP
ncbi:hypothetical protein FRC07_005981, partial [Ceratobasidium sp. 392]